MQELARRACAARDQVSAPPAAAGAVADLWHLTARRCQARPDARRVWRQFQASPRERSEALARWLEREIQAYPGFARQVQDLWRQFMVRANRLPASATVAERTRAARDPDSLLAQALPTPIQQMWSLCAPDSLTQSMIASVEKLHAGQPLPARVRALAHHMTHYLRLVAPHIAEDSLEAPLYFDRALLELLEAHLNLPASAAATRSAVHAVPAPPAPTPAEPASQARTLLRHAEMECPARVWAGSPLITVKVRLRAPQAHRTSPHLALTLREDMPVGVWIASPGFDILGPHVQTLRLQPDQDVAATEFELQPRAPGRTYVSVNWLQGGTPLGSIIAEVEIAEHVTTTEQKRQLEASQLAVEPDAESPDLTLFVHYDTMQAKPRLLMNLYCDGELSQTYAPLTLNMDPSAYHEEIYGRLSDLTDMYDLKKADSAALASMQQTVRSLGHGLWNDLIPQGLQERYAMERAEWRDKSLLVITDEPHIPWELMWPYGYQGETWEDDAPWCLTMRMTRWLHRDSEGSGLPGPPARLPLERFAFVGPANAALAAVNAEGADLKTLMQRAGVQDASPRLNDWTQVQALLEAGAYDWFHLASHGAFAADQPDQASAIQLEGPQPFTPDALVGPRIQSHLFQQRPGFVLNACHAGRQGWALTRLGGWAYRLVGSGAGVFMGPLWTVTDESARRFAAHFYARLLEGDTVAEALHGARRMIRETGDPTWIAYSAYAHPNARLRRRAASEQAQAADAAS